MPKRKAVERILERLDSSDSSGEESSHSEELNPGFFAGSDTKRRYRKHNRNVRKLKEDLKAFEEREREEIRKEVVDMDRSRTHWKSRAKRNWKDADYQFKERKYQERRAYYANRRVQNLDRKVAYWERRARTAEQRANRVERNLEYERGLNRRNSYAGASSSYYNNNYGRYYDRYPARTYWGRPYYGY